MSDARRLRASRRLVIFDLDNTLVHRDDRDVFHARPFAIAFLKRLKDYSAFLDVGFWSAASPEHVQQAVKLLTEKSGIVPAFVKDRRNCRLKYDPANGEYSNIKDLCKIRRLGWSIYNILIVEDKPTNCVRNYGNAAYVSSWYCGDAQDRELRMLWRYLKRHLGDLWVPVRSVPLQRRWHTIEADQAIQKKTTTNDTQS